MLAKFWEARDSGKRRGRVWHNENLDCRVLQKFREDGKFFRLVGRPCHQNYGRRFDVTPGQKNNKTN